MTRLDYFLACLCVLPLTGMAQQRFASDTLPKAEIRLAYVGSVVYPGARLGLALPVRQLLLLKRNGQKAIRKDWHLALNVGGYHHLDFHDNVYLTAEWQLRRTKASGWFTEFSPGLGYSRTFLGGTTYRVTDNGTVSIRKAAGYNYGLLTIGGGVGYDFAVKTARPVLTFFRANLLTMLPYNRFVYVRPTVELGLAYQISTRSVFKPRSKTIQK